jgi:hypothetical protein
MKNIYSYLVLKEMPRLFSLLDSNRHSPTFGCLDKNYWKYKTLDYANARMQEACLTLALLYKNKIDGNFYKNEKIKEQAVSAVKFWAKIQNRDGSLNEYLPNEHSPVATAFSTYCIAKTFKILEMDDTNLLESLKKAGKWLGKNDDLSVINHDAGAITSLYLIYELTKEKKFLEYCKDKIERVLKNQDREGWFMEYGGADPGYQSFSIYYLANYYKMSKDKKILGAIKKAVDFFSYFIHPDLSMAGIYGSRETSFIIPTGFEILSYPLSKSIAWSIRRGLGARKIIGPYSFDDRFLACELYPYLEASILKSKDGKVENLPKDGKPFAKYFKNAGIYVRKTDKLYMIINVKKGGIMKIYNKNSPVYIDGGWVMEKDRKIMTTKGPSKADVSEDQIKMEGGFYSTPFTYQRTASMISFRLMNSLGIHDLIKWAVRKKLIYSARKSGIVFSRNITIKGDTLEIKDKFVPSVNKITLVENFPHIFSTSTGLYEISAGQKILKEIEKPTNAVNTIVNSKNYSISSSGS